MKTFKNYLYNMVYQVLVLIVPLVTTPYVSRVLQVDGVGKYSVTQAVMQYFVLFGLLGMATYGSRQIAYVRENVEEKKQAFWDLNYTRLITMGLATIGYIIFIQGTGVNKNLYLVLGITVLSSLVDISWYFAGLERFRTIALRNILVKVICVILIFVFVKTKSDLVSYAFIMSASMFIGQATLWIGINKEVGFKKPNWNNIRLYLLGSFKLWLPSLAASIYTSFDKIMLKYFTDDIQVGIYVNSLKIVIIASTVTTALSIVTIPKAANSYSNGKKEELRATVYKSLYAVSFLAFPMAFGLMAVRKTLVPWFLGDGYDDVTELLLISSLLILTLSWSSILANQILVASKKENYYTFAIVLAAVANFTLNIFLIPKYKAMGSMLTLVFAEYLGMFVMLYYSREFVSSKVFFKGILKYLISGAIMYLFVYPVGFIFGQTIIATLIQICVGVIVYCGIMLGIKDQILLYVLNSLKLNRK